MTELILKGSSGSFRLVVQPPRNGESRYRWLDVSDSLEGEFVDGRLTGIIVASLDSLFDENDARHLVEYFGAGEGFDANFGPFEVSGRVFVSLESLLRHLRVP